MVRVCLGAQHTVTSLVEDERDMRLRQFSTNLMRSLTTAHSQRVASLYLITFSLFILVGAAAALALQLELWSPASTLFSGQLFGRLLTQHGLVMTFVVLIPLIPGVFGNLLLPSAAGARDMAMQRTNVISWVMHLLGATAIMVAVQLGAYDFGWTMKMPLEATGTFQLLVAGLCLVAVSTFLMNLVIVRTILSRKHRAMPLSQLPVLAWFFLVGSLVIMIVSPIRFLALTLLSLHPLGYTPLFSLLDADGIIRYQHLFWAYAGPATFAATLPAIGITFETLSACAGTHLFARRAVIVAGVALGPLSLVAWGQHLLTATDSETLAMTGSLFSLLTAVPTSLILLSWLVMLSRTKRWRSVPILITWLQTLIVALGSFVGIVLAIPSTGLTLHNSYLATGHLHLIALGLVLLSFLASLFHWWPIVLQRPVPRAAGQAVAMTIVVGIITTYFPMLFNGLKGLPSAVTIYPDRFQAMHMVSTCGTVILMVGLVGATWLFARIVLGMKPSSGVVTPAEEGEISYLHAEPLRIQGESR